MGGFEGGLKSWALFTMWCSTVWVENYKSTLPCPLAQQREFKKEKTTPHVLFDSAARFEKYTESIDVVRGEGSKILTATVMDGLEGD